jgi:aspartate aminotransferase
MRLAGRMNRLGTETAFEVLARARALEGQGRHIVHLEIGEPDFDTPPNVVAAGVRALQGGATHYSPAAGIPELRLAVAEDCGRRRGLSFGPENVVVTPGAKPIIFFVMTALLEEGDSVAYPDPGFPIYESMVDFLGARRIPIGYHVENGRYRFDVDDLVASVNPRTRLIVLNSPSNPTGAMMSHDDLARVAEAARSVDAIVLADEIYGRIVYEGAHESIAAQEGMLGRTVILDGFSKTYAMTGWRLGYGVMPEDLATAVTRLMINSDSCTATFTQLAGVEALTGPQSDAEAMVEEFRRRRDLIVDGLNAIEGVQCALPTGAFYAFPDIRGTGMSSRQAADFLLHEAGVAVLSGTAFGANGEGYLRLSYANSYENIELALERISSALRRAPALVRG